MTTTCAARVTRAQRTSTGCCVHTGAAAPRIAARPARSPLGGVALPVRTRRAPTLVARAEPEAKGEPEIELDLDTGAAPAPPQRPSERFAVIDTGLWECKSCQYVFNEAKGDPEFPVAAGTPFKSVADDYQCPVCGANKNLFVSKSKVVAGFAENQGYGLGTNTMTSGQKSILIYGSLAVFFALFISGYLLD